MNLVLIGVGFPLGILSAVLGVGGGLLMVPVLTMWGIPPIQAIGSSLIGVFMSSVSGSTQNFRSKLLNLERIILLAFPAMLTTELGVAIANKIPSQVLFISFAILQIVSIYFMALKHRVAANSSKTQDSLRIYPSTAIGLLAGLLSGIFGVGGGVVMVPLQIIFLGENIKDAVRTSLGAMTLISLWALGRHALSGNVIWMAGFSLGIGGLIGAQIGSRLLPKLPENIVALLFRSVLIILALYMSYRAFA